MELSSDLIREFAKNTKDEPTVNQGTTVYGTFRVQDGETFVQIDGSDTRTPVASTVTAKSGDRVTVLIKDHRAIVTGNLEDPSASSEEVKEVKKTMGQSALDIEDLKRQFKNQEITLQEYSNAIAEAKRKATDYINFVPGTGLIVGSTSISNNVLIYSGGMDIRDGDTVLARYTDDLISLGTNSTNSVIELCGGLGTIQSISGELAFQSNFIRIHAPNADANTDPWLSVGTNGVGLYGGTSNMLYLNSNGGQLKGNWMINASTLRVTGEPKFDQLSSEADNPLYSSYKLVVVGTSGILHRSNTSLKDLTDGSMKVTATFG